MTQFGFNLIIYSKHQATKLQKTELKMDEQQLQAKAAEIKMIILDVDGVMTDGRTFVNEQRIEAKAFSYRDGFGIYMASKVGITFGIITGKKSPIVE